MHKVLRVALAVGAGTTVVALAATASAAPTSVPITGGKTVIAYDSATYSAAKKGGLHFAAVTGSSNKNGKLTLGVSGGTDAQPNYVIDHTGGLTITHGSKTVQIIDIVVDTSRGRATAKVTGKGRVTAFVIGAPQRGGGGPHFVSFGGYPVTLVPSLVGTLDKALGTTVFSHHGVLGTGDTTIDHN